MTAASARWNTRVWALAGPIILSNLSTPLLGAVDTAVVGHLPDAAYIGGVAVGATIFSFLFWGFGFLRMGTTGFTAQAFGAEDRLELRATLARALLLAGLLGFVLVLLQAPIGDFALTLIGPSDKVEALAQSYYGIRIWSAPAALANYAIIGWLLGMQRAGTVLVLQIVLNGINILLDLVFVIGFGWGVEGVAYASLIAELCAFAIGCYVVAGLLHSAGGHWDWSRLLNRERLVALFRVNLDILVRTLCLIFALAYITARSAAMGDVILAGNAILMQLQNLTAYGLDGFAHAAEVLAGGAYGARSRRDFPPSRAAHHALGARNGAPVHAVLSAIRHARAHAVHGHSRRQQGHGKLPNLGRGWAIRLGMGLPARRYLHRHDPLRGHAQCDDCFTGDLLGRQLAADPDAREPRLVAGLHDLHGGARADVGSLLSQIGVLDRITNQSAQKWLLRIAQKREHRLDLGETQPVKGEVGKAATRLGSLRIAPLTSRSTFQQHSEEHGFSLVGRRLGTFPPEM